MKYIKIITAVAMTALLITQPMGAMTDTNGVAKAQSGGWTTSIAGSTVESVVHDDANGFIYAGTQDGNVVKLHANNGTIIWDTDVDANANIVQVLPLNSSFQDFYVRTTGNSERIHRLNSDGGVEWSTPEHGEFDGPMGVDNVTGAGYYVYLDGSFNTKFVRLEPDGTETYDINIGENNFNVVQIDGSNVSLVGNSGSPSGLTRRNKSDGSLAMSSVDVDVDTFGNVLLDRNYVIGRQSTNSSNVLAYNSTEEVAWNLSLEPSVAVDGGLYNHYGYGFTSGSSGNVYQFTRNNGTLVGTISFSVGAQVTDLGVNETSGAVYAGLGDGSVTLLDSGGPTYPSAEDPLYIGTTSPNTVQRINQSDGSEVWNTTVDGGVDGDSVVEYTLDQLIAGTSNGTVYKLNQTDGSVEDTYSASASIRSLEMLNGSLYAGLANGSIEVIDPGTLTTINMFTDVHNATGVNYVEAGADGYLYTGGEDEMVVKLAPDGTEQWRTGTSSQTDESRVLSLSYTDNAIVAATTQSFNGVVGLYRSNGTERYRFDIGFEASASTARNNTKPVIGSIFPEVYALDENGQQEWTYGMSGDITGLAAGNDERVYAGDENGVLVGLDPAGSEEWNSSTGGSTTSMLIYDLEVDPPSVNNSSASPSGNPPLEDNEQSLSIDVSDGDFPSDEVSVEFFVNGTSVGTDTLASNGTASVVADDLGPGLREWNVTATDRYGQSTTSQSFFFTVIHRAPVINNSSAVPTGGVNKDQDSLDIWVGDRDFDDSTGDTVQVAFTHNGVLVDTVTATSNGTVEYEGPTDLAGPNEWSVTATDSYSLSTTSQTFTYTLPDTVTIYNESDPLVPIQNASAEVEFYFDRDSEPDLIDFRNASNGTLNMTGLPADEDFVIVVRADGYYNRRVWFPSLLRQQNMYLLPQNETAVQPTFTLIDFTGEFEREQTVLQIQRGLNESWETVEGDYFGAANRMSAQLAYNERHRLIVVNTVTNRSRELGSFTPTASTTVELEVHQNNSFINEKFYPTVQFDPDTGGLPGTTGVNVSARILANGNELDEYSVHFVTSDGTSLVDETHNDDGGVHNYTLDLGPHTGQSATFWLNWTTADGVSENISASYTIDRSYPNDYSLLSIVLGADLGGDVPNALSILITLVLALFATAYASTLMGSGPAGLVGIGVAAGAAVIGWVPLTWIVATAVGWVVLAGVRNRI